MTVSSSGAGAGRLGASSAKTFGKVSAARPTSRAAASLTSSGMTRLVWVMTDDSSMASVHDGGRMGERAVAATVTTSAVAMTLSTEPPKRSTLPNPTELNARWMCWAMWTQMP